MTKSKYDTLALRHARLNGEGALITAKDTLLRAAEELQQYQHRYSRAKDDAERAHQLNFAIHYLCSNILGNARVDLLAKAQAELQVLAATADEK